VFVGGFTGTAALIAAWIALGLAGGNGPNKCAAYPAFPDAECTGIPPWVELSTYDGPMNIDTPDVVIEGQIIDGCLAVRASGVIIRNSRITCVSGITVNADSRTFSGDPLEITDSELSCRDAEGQPGPGTALGDSNITARRLDVSGCENGLSVSVNVDIQDSYIHGFYNGEDNHADGIQFGNHYNDEDPPEIEPGVRNITIKHNTIFGIGEDGSFTTSAIITGPLDDTDVLIERNLLGGGGYTIYCGSETVPGVNYRVISNSFTNRFKSTIGFFGPATNCGDDTALGTITGNTVYETGAPLVLP
jgi:hypothetical protein